MSLLISYIMCILSGAFIGTYFAGPVIGVLTLICGLVIQFTDNKSVERSFFLILPLFLFMASMVITTIVTRVDWDHVWNTSKPYILKQ